MVTNKVVSVITLKLVESRDINWRKLHHSFLLWWHLHLLLWNHDLLNRWLLLVHLLLVTHAHWHLLLVLLLLVVVSSHLTIVVVLLVILHFVLLIVVLVAITVLVVSFNASSATAMTSSITTSLLSLTTSHILITIILVVTLGLTHVGTSMHTWWTILIIWSILFSIYSKIRLINDSDKLKKKHKTTKRMFFIFKFDLFFTYLTAFMSSVM